MDNLPEVAYGRTRRSVFSRVAIVNTGYRVILPPDPTIVAVMLFPNDANAYSILPSKQVVGHHGLLIAQGVDPIILRVEDVGDFIFNGLSAVSGGGNFSLELVHIIDTGFRAGELYQPE